MAKIIIGSKSNEPEKIVLQKAEEFAKNFKPYELENGIPLLMLCDNKSQAFYMICHLPSNVIAASSDIDATLEPGESEDYKLNREIYTDNYAYKKMTSDASQGRSFEDLVAEYDTSYRPQRPLKVFGGQHRIKAITENLKNIRDMQLETFNVGIDKLVIVTIAPDPDKMDKDIALPVLSPILTRKKTLAEEIAGLDIATMTCPVLPLKEDDATAQTFKYEGYDIITLKKIIERDYTLPEAQTSQEVISYYAKRIAQEVKLPSQFAVLVPKVREFLAIKAFGEQVNLEDPVLIKAISTNVAQYVTVKTFVEALRALVVERLEPHLLNIGRKLSDTEPFPYSRLTCEAKKTVFNLVPCDSHLEERFARFLDSAKDVTAFAKLPEPFGFTIEYIDAIGNLRYYEPDFVVVLSDGSHYLVETKGLEDATVPHKDRAAQIWCENATLLTDIAWQYIKVPQKEFDKLEPTQFSDLLVFTDTKML